MSEPVIEEKKKLTAQELRIGNYFHWSPWASMGVGIDKIRTGADIDSYTDFKEPIPLTEDWLLRMGFEPKPWGWVQGGFLISWNIQKETFWIEIGNGKRIELPYVHTVQNFFALTSQELTIKE